MNYIKTETKTLSDFHDGSNANAQKAQGLEATNKTKSWNISLTITVTNRNGKVKQGKLGKNYNKFHQIYEFQRNV